MKNSEKEKDSVTQGYCYLKFENSNTKVLCLSGYKFYEKFWENVKSNDIFIGWCEDMETLTQLISTVSVKHNLDLLTKICEDLNYFDICPIFKITTSEGEDKLYLGFYGGKDL